MDREEERLQGDMTPAIGERSPDPRGRASLRSGSDAEAELASERPSRLVLDIARLIGRQMAREDYRSRTADNSNRRLRADGDGA